MEKSTLLPLIFLGLILNYPWMILANRPIDFSGNNSLSSSSNEKSIMVVNNNPHKISNDQQYMDDAHDVPEGSNPGPPNALI